MRLSKLTGDPDWKKGLELQATACSVVVSVFERLYGTFHSLIEMLSMTLPHLPI